jgi:dethiobiotin synthetase
MSQAIAILGIHTGIGKTVVSAVLAQALGADYWKPVQAGGDPTDTELVRSLVDHPNTVFHPERYRLRDALSPHAAAANEGLTLQLSDFVLPKTTNRLLVETAGGVLSPVTDQHTALDLVEHLQVPVILVSQAYLGSINHTLLCMDVLKQRGTQVLGLIHSGPRNIASEDFIHRYAPELPTAHVEQLAALDAANVRMAANAIRHTVHAWLA